VLEAFVGVLSTAVHHIQEGLTTTTHPPNVAFNNTANTSVPTTSSTSETCTGDHSASVGTEAAGSVKTTTQPEPENTTTITEDVTGSGPPSSGSSNQMPSNGEHITEESRPFIHGRHTCDRYATSLFLTVMSIDRRGNFSNPVLSFCLLIFHQLSVNTHHRQKISFR
jgi:hypothetical protein